jgi:ABC-2 type transporter.
MFGVFVFLFVVIQVILQIIPMFVTQRTLYEARERQSRTYAWQAFVLSNIMVEIVWNSVRQHLLYFATTTNNTNPPQLVSILCFLVWFLPP